MEQGRRPNTRLATLEDIDRLLDIEAACFDSDRLSKRSFRHHIQSTHSVLWCVDWNSQTIGYALVLMPKGTRLARLYSLAIHPVARGHGLATFMLSVLEAYAAEKERHYMRLEVSKNNHSAIQLYTSQGYRVFGEYHGYYDDHTDALRMQKRIRFMTSNRITHQTPWFKQSTDFTCGPASLLMAMSSLDTTQSSGLIDELAIWREATTIFMTSGHGGCHPFGLALAAQKRDFLAQVWVNTTQPLFVDGVRTAKKKHIMSQVHLHFLQQCEQQQISIHYEAFGLEQLSAALAQQHAVLMLVSTYRLDDKKAPHWVVITGIDEHCLFVHDPDLDEMKQIPMDCQHIPIAKADFDKMSMFGSQRLRAAIVISKKD